MNFRNTFGLEKCFGILNICSKRSLSNSIFHKSLSIHSWYSETILIAKSLCHVSKTLLNIIKVLYCHQLLAQLNELIKYLWQLLSFVNCQSLKGIRTNKSFSWLLPLPLMMQRWVLVHTLCRSLNRSHLVNCFYTF